MPVILPAEQDPGILRPLLDGISPTIGWHFRAPGKGASAFVILRRTGLGSLKVVESFPVTEDGWAAAWRFLASRNPAAVPQVLARLDGRNASAATASASVTDARQLSELEARSLVSLPGMAYLGGHVPGAAVTPGAQYDMRFLEDRLVMSVSRRPTVLAEVLYGQVEDVEIGGPGIVKSGGGFAGGGFGLAAVEGMAIAAALNALTTRTSVKTVMRIQATACELFLLHTKLPPEQLRIEMSGPLTAIRAARAAGAAAQEQGRAARVSSPVEELAKLAAMLEKGLLTREEFNLMKAKLLGPRDG